MSFERKRKTEHPDFIKAKKEVMKIKKVKVSIIFNQTTHRMIKALTATEGGKISSLMEKLAHDYLKEKGKL